jgi:DNA-binding winged helix-turn-helix (wHTH) protein
MRWKVGDRTFDPRTKRVTGTAKCKLNSRQAKLLEFLIVNYDQPYNSKQLQKAVWEGGNAAGSIHKYIGVLRDALGGAGRSLEARKRIIDTGPYRLMIRPELIEGDESACEPVISVGESGASVSGKSTTTSPDNLETFTLVVDGMIINSVSELINSDPETESIRETCGASYERSLEDLAFATVYADRLITGKDFRPSLTTPDQPGQELAARLGEICDQRAFSAKITDGHLLRDEVPWTGIRDDIRRFSQCLADRHTRHYFRDYMAREATKHLGTDLTLFQDDIAPAEYRFNVKRAYYTDRQLQDELGSATDVLVSFLPDTPRNSTDRYATNALREFATRNVLSLITIMWEGQEYAKDKGARRAPHILRALVEMKKSKDHGSTQHQEIARDLVVEHALKIALRSRQEKNRHNIVGVLLNLRDDYPFKQIRKVLNEAHVELMEPVPKNEKAVLKIMKQLKALTGSAPVGSDKVRLARDTAVRALGGNISGEYVDELLRVFPELAASHRRDRH